MTGKIGLPDNTGNLKFDQKKFLSQGHLTNIFMTSEQIPSTDDIQLNEMQLEAKENKLISRP